MPTQIKVKIRPNTKRGPAPARRSEGPVDWTVEELALGKYTQILHMSDIHIRPLQRHEEFRQVFQNVQSALSSLDQKSITVITGDIFDNKTNFKPETFMLCRDFLKMITQYTPLLVIAGNHDMLENNTNRLDAITPVVDDIPRLHYLKYSGLYFNTDTQTCFVVSSLYDKEFIEHNQIVNSKHYRQDYHYVALYHGTLTGSATDVGYVVEDGDGERVEEDSTLASASTSTRYRTVDDFKDYDAVLLGDIHKYQILNAPKPIAYAGSLIQQNHGEKRTNHGILHWNVSTFPVSAPVLKSIDNQYGFVDIVCHDGEWVNESVDLPNNCYARLVIKNCTETQIDAIVATVKTRVETLNITKRQCITDNLDEFEIPPDIKRKEDELELIREQAVNNGYDPDKLISLHHEYQLKLDAADQTMCTAVWRPVLLEFKNMFGYGDNQANKIFFKQGVTSISAGNTCGKTSIVNIILFAIFGRTPLNPSNSTYTFDIINNKQSSGYVKLLLNHGGQYYLIERKTVRKNCKSVASPVLKMLNRYDFSCKIWKSNIKGEHIKNICETRKNNNDTCIRELFGDITDFSLSNLLNKESSLDLLSMAPAEQIKVLKKLFKLEIYDSYKDLNKQNLLEMETAIKDSRTKHQTLESLVDTSLSRKDVAELEEKVGLCKDDLTAMQDNAQSIKEERMEFVTERQRIAALIHPTEEIECSMTQEELETELETYRDTVDSGEHSSTIAYRLDDNKKQLASLHKESKEIVIDADNLEELQQELLKEKEALQELGLTSSYEGLRELDQTITRCVCDIEVAEKELKSARKSDVLLQDLSLVEAQQCLQDLLDKDTRGAHYNISHIEERIRVLSEQGVTPTPLPAGVSTKHTDYDTRITVNKSEIHRLKREASKYEGHTAVPPEPDADIAYWESQIQDAPSKKHNVSKRDATELEKKIAALDKKIHAYEAVVIINPESYVDKLEVAPMVDKEIKDMYGLDDGTDYLLVEEQLADKISSHLRSGALVDKAKTAEIEKVKLEHRLEQICQQLEDNRVIDSNERIGQYIAYLHWQGILDSIKDLQLEVIESTKLSHLCELHELMRDREQHAQMKEDQDKITAYQEYIRSLETEARLAELQNVLRGLQLHRRIYEINCQIEAYHERQEIKEQMIQLEADIQSLQVKYQQQRDYDRKLELVGMLNNMVIIQNNAEYSSKIDVLDQQLADVEEDLSEQEKEIRILQNELSVTEKQLSLLSYRVTEQEKIAVQLAELDTLLIDLEQSIVPYQQYAQIVGTKGITSKLLFNKIKSIEEYINTIIRQFTKYQIHILYDEKKQNINIITENKSTGKFLSTTRLSGYEKLMLQIAFKRALNKFSYNSKSSLIIIDEALDCIDQENFTTKLPMVMNLITQDYSTCLAISQRDITHISDNIIKIRRTNGNSSISA